MKFVKAGDTIINLENVATLEYDDHNLWVGFVGNGDEPTIMFTEEEAKALWLHMRCLSEVIHVTESDK